MTADMTPDPFRKVFEREVQQALLYLYNPAKLQQSPLSELLASDNQRLSPAALGRLLLDAIQALKPIPEVPISTFAWRLYHVLTYRYVEQSSQKEVAADLALSVRQLRRQEQAAVQVLADYLWGRYQIDRKTRQAPAILAPNADLSVPANRTERERELAWVRESFPHETANLADVIEGVLKTIDPLLEAAHTQVDWPGVPGDPLLPVASQAATLRQTLLSLLTAVAHAAPGGRIELTLVPDTQTVSVRVHAVPGVDVSHPSREEVIEKVEMTRDLLRLTGGTLTTPPRWTPGKAFTAILTLPLAEQVSVLVIDDNLDTLQLLQRYLEGTRYRFVGVRDPEQALAQAQAFSPRLIILDVMLPGVDGWEVLGRLRENPAFRPVPIIVSTILPQEELALTLGAATFLRKPVSRETLLTTLDHWLTGVEPK
jgi:CheY-like chemotaxis protein